MIRNLDSAELVPVEMEGADRVRMAVMVGRDDGAPHFAMRQFMVDAGGHTPRHHHDYEHEVLILEGSGTAHLSGDDHAVTPGDVLYVPAMAEHQFRAGADGLRFICLAPTSRNCGEPTPGT